KYKICPDNKLTAITNGMPEITPEYFADPSKQPPLIVMVARFCEQKDHHTLLQALAPLSNLDWHLKLIGDGDSQTIKKEIKHLKLSDKITLSGYQSNIDEILSTSQIFVLSSLWEGLPLSIIEAMRAGLPVIATDIGGVSEAIIHGKTGYLVNSIETLSTRLKQLITDPKHRLILGKSSQKHYRQNLSLKNQLEKTFSVYDDLLSKY
ncbi:MAG TPA: glycosyltransferase, partial [Thiotrichaceae bacterium]|nr:glycosyltransferase [Thiotrichaceae bacterium]